MKHRYLMLIVAALATQTAFGHGPKPGPLVNLPIPDVPGLLDGSAPIVVDKNRAIALGKALFWDTNVGSDGMACASCHFHAGADVRVKNQLNPGLKGHTATGDDFSQLNSGEGGPNHTLVKQDFPLHQRANPFDKNSAPIRDTDDVVASSGTFSGEFKTTSRFTGANDSCDRSADDTFNVGHINTRRVEPRNAPTVINTIFNFRNFWDGRANNVFNGVSPWGDRDPDAGIWVKTGARSIAKQRLRLENASLASLAMGPPFSDTEMSCRQRRWADIGRKLLSRQPLQYQKVHHQDSVFGPLGLTNSTATNQLPGLKTTYRTLVTQAFNPKYWSYSGSVSGFPTPRPGEPAYSQVEVNFSLFFGIALQMYQATLISDQAPIDQVPRILSGGSLLNPKWNELYPDDPAKAARLTNGFNIFMANHCATCHAGPLGTSAAVVAYAKILKPTPGAFYGPDVAKIPYGVNALGPFQGGHVAGLTQYANVVTRDITVAAPPNSARFRDIDFANTGVTDPENDHGLMTVDDFGNPLSFSYQYQQYLAGYTQNVVDSVVYRTRACDFIAPLVDPFGAVEPDTEYFNDADQLEIDGARDGVNKSTGCIVSDLSGETNVPKIPTVAAARAALASGLQKMAIGDKAAFKIPTLRNVELTGPYMHNGSMATLEQVIEFYARKGNFINENQHHFLDGINLVGNALPLGSDLTAKKNRDDLIEFLKTLTDDRVRYERAPFDHPEIKIPHGHKGNAQAVDAGNTIDNTLAIDEMLVVPAVGASGAFETDGVTPKPIKPFIDYLSDTSSVQ